MLNEESPLALYHQLKNILIKKIKSNEWPVNTKIPTERELCETYAVSRITVRQALNELGKDGYLYRKQGKGTFVTTPKIEQRLGKFYSFSEEIRKMGFTPGTEVLDFRLIDCDKDSIAAGLNMDKHEKVYSIRRRRLADGEPFAVETSYIPYNICPDLNKESISTEGLYNSLKNNYGINPDEAVETFEAVLINENNANELSTSVNLPGISLERFTYAKGRVVEYCRSIIRGDRYKYKVVLK